MTGWKNNGFQKKVGDFFLIATCKALAPIAGTSKQGGTNVPLVEVGLTPTDSVTLRA